MSEKTLSVRSKSEYRPTQNGPRPQSNRFRSNGQRPERKPPQNKATYAHEAHLNSLLGKKVVLITQDSKEEFEKLVGYDAFTLTVEHLGHTITFFKNQLVAFCGVREA